MRSLLQDRLRQSRLRGEVLDGRAAYGEGLCEAVLKGCLLPQKNVRYLEQSHCTTRTMSEEQLTALLAKLKADTGLQEKLKGAADLDAAVALAKAAGFDVTNEDFLNFRTTQTVELSDEDLENVSGGATPTVLPVVALVGAAFGLMEGGR